MNELAMTKGMVNSSDGEVMIKVRDLHVQYRAYRDRARRLRTRFLGGGRDLVNIDAIKGVDLEVSRGEVVGIVGSNGSGKSTLLRAIAGLQPAARGEVLTRVQPVLLGVGSALKAELSGRRNITIGGLALGLSRSELEELCPSIVEFADLGDAIDRPLKTYSSGMRARLHFAIATAISPEILLLDEALAVGDKSFKERSLERLHSRRQQAGAVVLVSHSLNEVSKICTRAVWLDSGAVRSEGEVAHVVGEYSRAD